MGETEVSALLYLASILGANILVSVFHLVKVGPLVFPAGAVLIGLTFSARDFVQRRYGKWGCWWWMLLASAITMAFNTEIALASMAAFIVAEGMDWLIYTLLEKKPMRVRVVASNIVGIPLDSVVFVVMAFGWVWPAMWGQTVVKLISSMTVLPFMDHER